MSAQATAEHWSIPPGSRSSFPSGTPIADVKRARDEAHKKARDRLRSVEKLTAELADLYLDDEGEDE